MALAETCGWQSFRAPPRQVAVYSQKEICMRADKIAARKHGIPKAHRQYAKRYGSGIGQMIADQKKYQQRRWPVGDRRGKVQ